MNGADVFNFVLKEIPKTSNQFWNNPKEYQQGLLILISSNQRLYEQLLGEKKLKLETEKSTFLHCSVQQYLLVINSTNYRKSIKSI
jgi:hypothetical protein